MNTPDILTEYLQFGGPAAFTVRATIAATAAPTWGVYSGFELFESVARPGAEEAIDNEKYEYKPRDFAAAEKEGRSLALYLGILNAHPQRRTRRSASCATSASTRSDDDSVLVYSKHLDGRFTRRRRATTRSSSSPTSTRTRCARPPCTSISPPSASPPGIRFEVEDLVTGARWDWGDANYVRLDAFTQPAHILHVDARHAMTEPRCRRPAPPSTTPLLAAVAEGRHSDPHSVLGQHGFDLAGARPDSHTVIRTRRPLADARRARCSTTATCCRSRTSAHGIWAGVGEFGPVGLPLGARYGDGASGSTDDPYRFAPTIGELDLHLIGEGRHEQLWQVLGAHHREHWGVGRRRARHRVHRLGAARTRRAGRRRLQPLGRRRRTRCAAWAPSGVWELFVPDLDPGTIYKFELLTRPATGS